MTRSYTFKVTILDSAGEEHTFYRNVEGSGFINALHAALDEIQLSYTPDEIRFLPINFGRPTRTYDQARSCNGKDSYTEDVARSIAEHLNADKPRKGKITEAYKCRYCVNWHVGNRDA